MKENLGKLATDKVSGFKGTIVAIIYYLNGCTQYGIMAKVGKDNKAPGEAEYFDSQQVEIKEVQLTVKRKRTGGPQRDCPRN